VLGGEVVAQRREPLVEPLVVARVDRAVDGPAELLAAVVLEHERAVDPGSSASGRITWCGEPTSS
jgi:hypothetical protein